MPPFLRATASAMSFLLLTLAIPAIAVAKDGRWLGPLGVVNAGAAGNEAQVTANQQTSSGGSQAQPQPGYDADVPDSGSSGPDPWAKYTLVTNASGGQQLCLTVNTGLAGGPSRVQVCYDVAVPLPAPDGTLVAADPGVLAAQAVARLSVPARLRVTIRA